MATVLTGLVSAAPPGPPTTTVVRARVALAGGTLLSADDLETVTVPRDGLPAGTLVDPHALVGQRLAAPVPARTVLTSLAVVSAHSVAGPGHVLVPVRLADADVVALLRPGDVVDVLASDPQTDRAQTVARRLRVVSVPVTQEEGSAGPGALVLLDATASDSEPLAQAAATGSLTVIWP